MNFDSKAIVASEIENMKNAVETYTANVEEEIKKIKEYEIEAGDGVYGSAQVEKVNTYILNTCTEIGKIVRYFDSFQAALDAVNIAYEAQQQNVNISEVEQHKEADPEDLIKVNRME